MTDQSLAQVTAEFKAAHPELNGRVDRAAALVQAGAVIQIDHNTWQVQSQSGGEPYTVRFDLTWSCTCKDHCGGGYHPSPVVEFAGSTQAVCKHIIAAVLKWLAGEDIERARYDAYISRCRWQQQPTPAPRPVPVKDAYVPDFGLTDEQLALTPGPYLARVEEERRRRAGLTLKPAQVMDLNASSSPGWARSCRQCQT